MNRLEFIEKQILFVKQNIQYHKYLLTTVDDDESIEIIKSTIRLLEPDLQTLYQIKAELEEYQKLKDKETPKKVIHKHKEYVLPMAYRFSGKCPNCKNHVDESKYCNICGQKLDWGDTNE